MDIEDRRETGGWVTGWASFDPGTVLECEVGRQVYLRTSSGYVCLFDDYYVNNDSKVGSALRWRPVEARLVVG